MAGFARAAPSCSSLCPASVSSPLPKEIAPCPASACPVGWGLPRRPAHSDDIQNMSSEGCCCSLLSAACCLLLGLLGPCPARSSRVKHSSGQSLTALKGCCAGGQAGGQADHGKACRAAQQALPGGHVPRLPGALSLASAETWGCLGAVLQHLHARLCSSPVLSSCVHRLQQQTWLGQAQALQNAHPAMLDSAAVIRPAAGDSAAAAARAGAAALLLHPLSVLLISGLHTSTPVILSCSSRSTGRRLRCQMARTSHCLRDLCRLLWSLCCATWPRCACCGTSPHQASTRRLCALPLRCAARCSPMLCSCLMSMHAWSAYLWQQRVYLLPCSSLVIMLPCKTAQEILRVVLWNRVTYSVVASAGHRGPHG